MSVINISSDVDGSPTFNFARRRGGTGTTRADEPAEQSAANKKCERRKQPMTKIEWLLCIWRHNVSPSSWLVTFSSLEYFRRWKLSAFSPALVLSLALFTPFLAHLLRNEEAFRFYSIFISVRCASNANKTNIARDKMVLLAIDRSILYVVGRRWYFAMHSFALYHILLFPRESISSHHKCIYYCRGAPTRIKGNGRECWMRSFYIVRFSSIFHQRQKVDCIQKGKNDRNKEIQWKFHQNALTESFPCWFCVARKEMQYNRRLMTHSF